MKRYLLPLLVCGCEGLTSSPQPYVSALVRTGEGCFALMTPATPVAPSLGVANQCTYRASPQLVAGIDLVELVIDYGADVGFASSTAAPPPIVTVTVDGAAADVPITISEEHRVGDRAYFIATFYAPATPSNDIQITAGVNPGFRTTVPVVFSATAPIVELDLLDCIPGQSCELAGAVGAAQVRIVLPGSVPQTVTLHEQVAGVPQPDPLAPVTTEVVGGHTEALASVPVPAAADGSLLVLSTSLDGGAPSSVSAVIRAPAITAHLSCDPGCSLAAGDAVGLQIDAPALIRPLQARIDTTVDGTPELIGAPVELAPQANGTAVGTIALHAPAQPGTWQIVATVAGYDAPAIVTTVH
jgi:hypothetical protein